MLPLIGALVGAGASIYGANKASSDARRASRQQAEAIERGIGESEGYYNAGQNFLAPYMQSGQRYGAALDDSFGLGGPDGQARALEMYRSSPSATLMKGVLDEEARRFTNRFSANGGTNSGRMAEELATRNAGLSLDDYRNWQGFGQSMYGTGANAAGAASNLAAGRGRDILGARTGQGTAIGGGTMAGGVLGAAGIASAGNILGNYAGRNKTDFSQWFGNPSAGAMAPYGTSNPYGYSRVLPGGVGNAPY